MGANGKKTPTRVQKLQARINSALTESPETRSVSKFSPYILDEQNTDVLGEGAADVDSLLAEAASTGGVEGIEAAMDEYDSLVESVDAGRLRHALMLFLTHNPEAIKLGLRIPTLEQRSPSKVLPGKKNS